MPGKLLLQWTPPSGIPKYGVVDLYQIKAYHRKKPHNVAFSQFYVNDGVQLSDACPRNWTFPSGTTFRKWATGSLLCWQRGSDGKEDHMVCLADVWVFDSYCATTMPISREFLDPCCLSDETLANMFVQVVMARVFPGYGGIKKGDCTEAKKLRGRRRRIKQKKEDAMQKR